MYLTALPPKAGRKRIADNNWGGRRGPVKEGDGNVEHAIRLWIPRNKLFQTKSGRDILVHKGRIYLKDYEYEVERLDQGGGGDGGGGGWFKLIAGAAVAGAIGVAVSALILGNPPPKNESKESQGRKP